MKIFHLVFDPISYQAVTQELMLYWLQQLQVKRWQHRQTTSCPETMTAINNNNNAGVCLFNLSPAGNRKFCGAAKHLCSL